MITENILGDKCLAKFNSWYVWIYKDSENISKLEEQLIIHTFWQDKKFSEQIGVLEDFFDTKCINIVVEPYNPSSKVETIEGIFWEYMVFHESEEGAANGNDFPDRMTARLRATITASGIYEARLNRTKEVIVPVIAPKPVFTKSGRI